MLTLLWFDVEKRYNTTQRGICQNRHPLWFDVEKRYNTTKTKERKDQRQLWFDVEKRYNTTNTKLTGVEIRCGLM